MNNFQCFMLFKLFERIQSVEGNATVGFNDRSVIWLGDSEILEYTEIQQKFTEVGINEIPLDTNSFKTLFKSCPKNSLTINYPHVWDKPAGHDKEKVDIILNFSYSSKTLNQKTFFENAHNRLVCNGLFVHVVPWYTWLDMNFYSYTPSFFGRLAELNNYEILHSIVGTHNANKTQDITLNNKHSDAYYIHKYLFSSYNDGPTHGYRSPTYIGVIMKKTNNEPFKFYVQEDN